MKSYRTNRTRNVFRPGVDNLEGRCLLSKVGPIRNIGSPASLVDVLTYCGDGAPAA
jgi:hypothetical protein